jgi:hypothetical protein
MILFASPLNES